MFDFIQFFTPWYLFSKNPTAISQSFFMVWLGFSLTLVVAGIIVKAVMGKRSRLLNAWKRWWRKVGTLLIIMGFFSLILIFFRYERTLLFAARFWMLTWFIGALAWTAYLGYIAWQRVPADVRSEMEARRLQKYLPR